MVPGERVAEPVRKREHPLPDGQTAKHVVGQVGCQIRHSPPAARRTKPATLAREGDQDLVSAPVAAESGEATGHYAAGEKLAKLPLDEGGQTLARAAAFSRFLEERLEVFAEHAMENSVLGAPAYVRARSAIALAVDPRPG